MRFNLLSKYLPESFRCTFIKMKIAHIFLLAIGIFFGFADSKKCENGWVRYRNELCIKKFTKLLPFNDAKEFCASQGVRGSSKCSTTTTKDIDDYAAQENCPSHEIPRASLVKVTDADMQEFLTNYTHNTDDNLWLGSKYDNDTNSFKWFDGEPLSYTNWQNGYPRNVSGSRDACIELRPSNDELAPEHQGKWQEVRCKKRNLVICQKAPSWTLEDAVGEIIKMQKQLLDALSERNELRNQLQVTQQDLQNTHKDLQMVSSRVVPVGSIYVEYFGQPSPTSLWPDLVWQDISNTYAGLFFRASGGSAASWGNTQTDCAPRITQSQYYWGKPNTFPSLVSIPKSGWSPFVLAGGFDTHPTHEGIRFHSDDCEVRPRNQAIRIWKRTA